MPNMRVIWDNYIDTMTLVSAQAFETTLPLHNLTKQGRSTMARTTGNGTYVIVGNFTAAGTAKPVGGMCLWNHNMSPEGHLQLELFDGLNAAGTLLYDSGEFLHDGSAVPPVPPPSGPAHLDEIYQEWPTQWTDLFFTEVEAVSFRLTWVDTTTEGYQQASRLVLGPVYSPGYNPNYGLSTGWDEATEQQITQGGSVLSGTSIPARVLNFDLSEMDEDNRKEIMAMRRRVGKRRDFYISVFPDDTNADRERDYAMLGKFTNSGLITAARYEQFSSRFQIRET